MLWDCVSLIDHATIEAIEALGFDRIYGNFRNLEIESGAKDAVRQSVARYKQSIGF